MFDRVVSAPKVTALSLVGASLFSGCAATPSPTLPLKELAKPEQPSGFKLAPPIVETGVGEAGGRFRAYVDAQYDLCAFSITAHSFNDLNAGELNYFYGRESIGIKPSGMEQEFVITSEFSEDGYLDTQFGIRDNALAKMLGGYGFEHLVANDEKLTFVTFFGHSLLGTESGKPLNLELLQRCDLPYDGAPTYYSELQLTKMGSSNLGVFVRAEVSDFDLNSEATVVGLTAIF